MHQARQLEPLVIPENANPEAMTPSVLDEVALPVARVLEKWCKAVKQRATKLAMAGEDFENHKLVGRTRPVVLDDAPAVWPLIDDIMDLEDFLAATKVHLSQLRKAVGSAAPEQTGIYSYFLSRIR